MTSQASAPVFAAASPGLVGGEHGGVAVEEVLRRLAAVDDAAEVGAVAVDDAAEVEHDGGVRGDRVAAGLAVRVERVVVEPGEDVGGEGGALRAGGEQLVLDGLGELEHRDAGSDERRDGGHRLLDGDDRASHRGELVGVLRAAEPVDDRGAGAEAVEADCVSELKGRFRPDAVAGRDGARAADVLSDAREDGGAVVGLVDDDHLAVGLLAQVEPGVHPREQKERLAVGAEEGAGNPAVGVVDLAEAGDAALDAGQVLEVGGRLEEERVDAFLLEPLGESALARCVVEHAGDAS